MEMERLRIALDRAPGGPGHCAPPLDIADADSDSGSANEDATPPRASLLCRHQLSAGARRNMLTTGRAESSSGAESDTDDEEEFFRARQRVKARSAAVVTLSPPRSPLMRGTLPPWSGPPEEAKMEVMSAAPRLPARWREIRAGSEERGAAVEDTATAAETAMGETARAMSAVFCTPDLLSAVGCTLDLPSALALGAASHALHASLMSDTAFWWPFAAELGVLRPLEGGTPAGGIYNAVAEARAAAEPRVAHLGPRPARRLLAAMSDASRLRCGDCLEVMDPFQLWAVARVLCVVRSRLVLVHFEGYSVSWMMWLHRPRDAERMRPLSRACPGGAGASPREPHDDRSFHKVLEAARARLTRDGGRSEWTLDGPAVGPGSWPVAYTVDAPTPALDSASDVRVAHFQLTLDDAECCALLAAPTRPFLTAREYSKDRDRCRATHCAATLMSDEP